MPAVVLVGGCFDFQYFVKIKTRRKPDVDFVALAICAAIIGYILLKDGETYPSGAMLLLETFLRGQNEIKMLYVFVFYKETNLKKRIGFFPPFIAIFMILGIKLQEYHQTMFSRSHLSSS